MCDPVTIGIALASTLGSTVMQNMAANKVARARAGVIQRSNADLNKYRDEAKTSYDKSLESATPDAINAGVNTATQNRTAEYQAPVKSSDLLPGQGNASNAVKQQIIQTLGSNTTKSNDLAAKRGAFDAYGDASFGRDINMKRQGQNINEQGDFAAGRSSVVPLELDAANHAGDGYSNMAGVISGLGSVGGALYGGMSKFPVNMPKQAISSGAGSALTKSITTPLNNTYQDFVKNSGLWNSAKWG